jgi:hypothetical protein
MDVENMIQMLGEAQFLFPLYRRLKRWSIMSDINLLEAEAATLGNVIYNICRRVAGWGIQWYEENRVITNNWKDGLVVYKYYPTFEEMLEAELSRIHWLIIERAKEKD